MLCFHVTPVEKNKFDVETLLVEFCMGKKSETGSDVECSLVFWNYILVFYFLWTLL
jgi:hypothetical protein